MATICRTGRQNGNLATLRRGSGGRAGVTQVLGYRKSPNPSPFRGSGTFSLTSVTPAPNVCATVICRR